MLGLAKDILFARFKFVSRELENENFLSSSYLTIMKNNDLAKFLPLAKAFSNLPHECVQYNPAELSILTTWDLEYPYVMGDPEYDPTGERRYKESAYKAAVHVMLFDRGDKYGVVTSFDFRDASNNLTARFEDKPNSVKAPIWFRPLLLDLLRRNKKIVPERDAKIAARKKKHKGVMSGMAEWAGITDS
jgi:hypothetical protein